MVKSYDGATVEIVNWEKYNPRGDSKRPTWFRLENNIATGPAFFGLDSEQKWLWIVILSLVSQRNGDAIIWNSAYIHAITGIKPKKQDETLDIFEKFVRLRVSRKVTSDNSPTTNVRTNETNERDETHETLLVPAGSSPDRPLNARIWEAYRDEYKYRYQVEPTRNATVNTQIANLGKRLGEDAPEVVRFYLRHNKAFYVQNTHMIGHLLKDAESLHTQWQRGQAVLTTHGRDAERAQHNFDVFERAAENLDRRENSNVNG